MHRRARASAPEDYICIARERGGPCEGACCRRCRGTVMRMALRYIRLAATAVGSMPTFAVNCWLCVACAEDAHARAASYARVRQVCMHTSAVH